jgi:hypothetical protein
MQKHVITFFLLRVFTAVASHIHRFTNQRVAKQQISGEHSCFSTKLERLMNLIQAYEYACTYTYLHHQNIREIEEN